MKEQREEISDSTEIRSPRDERRVRFISLSPLLIFLFAVALYLPTLSNGFAFDDYLNIVDNPRIRSLAGVVENFKIPFFPGNLYRPITFLSHALVYSAAGLNPIAHHALNVLLNALVAFLLWSVVSRSTSALRLPRVWAMSGCPKAHLGDSTGATIALLCGLLFAAFPIHLEAVANITGRGELLSAVFGLAATRVVVNNFTIPRSFLCFVFLLLSSLSKESGIVWVAVPLVLTELQPPSTRERTRALLVTACTVVSYLLIRHAVFGDISLHEAVVNELDNPFISLSPDARALDGVALLGRYIAATVVPFSIGADYSYGYFSVSPLSPSLLAWMAVLIALGVVAAKTGRGGLGLIWFAWSFVLTSNIVIPIGTIFAERLAYTPSMGIAYLIACNTTKRSRLVACSAFISILALYTSTHGWIWRDNETLFARHMDVSSESVKSRLNYGIVLRNRGDLQTAGDLIRSTLDVYPQFPEAAYALGTIYLAKEIFSGAEHWLHRALELNPTHAPALQTLGRVYAREGKLQEAEIKFNQCLSLDPNDVRALTGLYAIAVTRADVALTHQLEQRLASLAPNDREFLEWRKKAQPLHQHQ